MRTNVAMRQQMAVAGVAIAAIVVIGCSGAGLGGESTPTSAAEEEQAPLSVPADPDHTVVVGASLPSDFRDRVESISPDPELAVDWHAIVKVNDTLYVVEIVSVQAGSDETTVQVPMTGSEFEWVVSGSAVYLWYNSDTGVVTNSVIQVAGEQISHGEMSIFIVEEPFAG